VGDTRRRFSEEFKREAVRLLFDGSQPVSQVARELDVRPDMLRQWRRSGSTVRSRSPPVEEQEVGRLRRELARTRERAGHPKKSLGDLLGAAAAVRFAVVERLAGQHPARRVCRLLGGLRQRVLPLEHGRETAPPPGRSPPQAAHPRGPRGDSRPLWDAAGGAGLAEARYLHWGRSG